METSDVSLGQGTADAPAPLNCTMLLKAPGYGMTTDSYLFAMSIIKVQAVYTAWGQRTFYVYTARLVRANSDC